MFVNKFNLVFVMKLASPLKTKGNIFNVYLLSRVIPHPTIILVLFVHLENVNLLFFVFIKRFSLKKLKEENNFRLFL